MIFAAVEGGWPFDLEIWALVVFGIIVTILVVFVGTPLSESMRRRRHQIIENLRQAQLANEELQRAREEHQKQRIKFKQIAEEIMAEAKADMARARQEILDRATKEAGKIQSRAQREISIATQRALHELWTTAADLSARLAEKVIAKKLDAADHRRLLEEAMAEVGSAAGEAA